ncbi:dihydrofolate reductase [Streptomyces pactum]|uniref:Dihydrofolate reductase n=1 Tax=Streptomyces pactum TaxID=68249 RepID=A0ABS0NHJ6_9ACTN|nr:dihydrofolate reductase family protein [Streptomyces pactum]MBH5334623.1 dihydrofolate reductase [Streptomyces pactum]
MAKVTLTTFLTLDGVMQGPGAPDEDTSGGFECGGWVVPYADPDMERIVEERFDRVTGFLLGRRTYEIFAAYWPRVTDPADPIASRLNNLPKYVASTTLAEAGWHNSTLVTDAAHAVRKLKGEVGGELQIHGSGELARSLLAHDLIDEMLLMVYPVVLGTGKRLFDEDAVPTAFELVGHEATGKGVAVQRYRLAGRPTFGSFALDD